MEKCREMFTKIHVLAVSILSQTIPRPSPVWLTTRLYLVNIIQGQTGPTGQTGKTGQTGFDFFRMWIFVGKVNMALSDVLMCLFALPITPLTAFQVTSLLQHTALGLKGFCFCLIWIDRYAKTIMFVFWKYGFFARCSHYHIVSCPSCGN